MFSWAVYEVSFLNPDSADLPRQLPGAAFGAYYSYWAAVSIDRAPLSSGRRLQLLIKSISDVQYSDGTGENGPPQHLKLFLSEFYWTKTQARKKKEDLKYWLPVKDLGLDFDENFAAGPVVNDLFDQKKKRLLFWVELAFYLICNYLRRLTSQSQKQIKELNELIVLCFSKSHYVNS